jgi:hypothetical protein
MKTTDDLYRAILAILPNATIDEDLDGQIIVYTNKREKNTEGELEEYDTEEVYNDDDWNLMSTK